MFSRRFKTGYFVLEGLNSFATVFYFYYYYFFMQKEFGFGNKANLILAALNGATYAIGVLWAGKLAHRMGYFTALKLGFGIMIGALALGAQLTSSEGQVLVMMLTVLGMCFTWPTLEALVSEGEDPSGVPHMVGLYNVIWAGTGAVSYFIGGAVMQKFGPRSLFYVPMTTLSIEFALTLWLQFKLRNTSAAPEPKPLAAEQTHVNPRRTQRGKSFLRMAWLANPFGYIGINTLIAVIPGVAHKLNLSTMAAGFCCSAWCFARMGSFILLWLWEGWHYRFRWLLSAFIALIASFAAILLIPNLVALVVAQLVFGAAIGLLYYSSLFYSMDLSETKSEHGGIHEAAIGLGNFAGPTVGAATLQFLPQYPNSGAVGVTVLLLLGLGGLLAIWRAATPAERLATRPARPAPDLLSL